MKNMNRKTQGFTLIELLVTATIIIVLTTIGMVVYSSAAKGSRDSKRKADLETIRQALVLKRTQDGAYPSSSATMSPAWLGTNLGDYLSQPYPQDPKSASGNTYEYAYDATTKKFTLSTVLENGGSTLELTSP